MTSAPMGGYEPPRVYGEPDTGPALEPDSSSKTDVAKDQAAQVGQSAKESGQQVASKAADEAKNVTAEARRHAKDLTKEASSQAQQQAAIGKDKAASSLHSLGDELRSMATQGGQSGPVTDLAHEAAAKVTDLASWLEQRDPGALLEEVRSLARRKPGTFLLGAAAAGILAGRLTRGVVQANKDDSSDSSSSTDSVGSLTTNSGDGTSYGVESTPIADSTAADTIFLSEPADGYVPAGRPL
jgi:hypothetical protein